MNRNPTSYRVTDPTVVRSFDPSSAKSWAKEVGTYSVCAKTACAGPAVPAVSKSGKVTPAKEHTAEVTDGDRFVNIDDRDLPDYKPPGTLKWIIRWLMRLIFDPWHYAKKLVNHIQSYVTYSKNEGSLVLWLFNTSLIVGLFALSSGFMTLFVVNANNYFATVPSQLMFSEYEWAHLSPHWVLLVLSAIPFASCLLFRTADELFGE